MKTKPLRNRVIIKRKAAETTRGGIILPDTAREKPHEGEVVAVGPGERNEEGKIVPMTVKVGDHVLVSSYSGTEVKENDEEFLIVSEGDILGIMEYKGGK